MPLVKRAAIRREARNYPLRELLATIDALPCEISRQAMRRVLKRLVGQTVFVTRRDVALPAELALAVSLMQTLSVAETRDALMVRLGIGRRKAYDLIGAALRERRDRRDYDD